ncbi:DeoR/GlpR family DNA-binding transcription regulator [Belnapia rosea]|uniref:Transcriptional regulator, DeoR family n=1 Tax=Belnapia rosea TaxID=938405 RepID=A0A1G6TLG7_9PROT|nr:DeoR/GlpR family DNA-binding transcription regulator [Belnapia rosea]SDD29928.1 transcriptional regulator, DeoR family [Belnapia rosea]
MRRSGTRREAILAAIAAGEADVDGLAARFGVSPSTIRRDLQRLSAERAIARTYGGAMLAPMAEEQSLGAREGMNRGAKAAIAAAALDLVPEGETLILDGGSTIAAFGRLLRGRRHRIITNNLPLIALLADQPGIELVVLGGAVRPISMSTSGPLAEAALRCLTADRLLTSADGLMPGLGLCEATLEQVSLKSLMMQRAAAVTVLADASKLGRAGQPCWAPLPARWTLVTDAPERASEAFGAEGAEVVRAPGAG